VLLPFVLVPIVSASDIRVRLASFLYRYLCLILRRVFFFLALITTTALLAKSTPEHCLDRGLHTDVARKNNICLIPNFTNIILSDSVAQRTILAASYVDGSGMTNEACVDFCNAKG
jgi:hypothetical protein